MKLPFSIGAYARYISMALIFLYLSLITSCFGIKQPEFKYMDPPQLLELNGNTATIKSTAYMYNPNKASVWMREMKLKVFHADLELGEFIQEDPVPLKGKSDFSIPFTMKVNMPSDQNSFLTAAMSILNNKGIELKFRGYAKVGGKKRGVKVPVSYTAKMKFK